MQSVHQWISGDGRDLAGRHLHRERVGGVKLIQSASAWYIGAMTPPRSRQPSGKRAA